MTFSILKCRKDKLALKKYIDSNKEYFSNIDEESYQTAKAMLGSSRAFAKGKYHLTPEQIQAYLDEIWV